MDSTVASVMLNKKIISNIRIQGKIEQFLDSFCGVDQIQYHSGMRKVIIDNVKSL